MANLSQLLALMGAQGAPAAETPTPDIEVTAPNRRAEQYVYDLQTPENTLIPIQQAPADTSVMPRTEASPQEIAGTQNLTGLPEHKGLFGIKGTLRNVLGTLGDALAGNQNFHNLRQQERTGDAMVGFNSSDPTAVQAAIARVAQVNPQAAQALAQQYQQRMNQTQRNDIDLLQAQGQAGKMNQEALQKGATLYANALRGMTATGQYNPQLLSRIQQGFGLPEEFTPPPQFDANWASPFISAGTPVNQQDTQDLNDQRLAEMIRHNQASEATARKNAERPRAQPQPRQPRAQTELEYFQEIGRKPANQRSESENAFYKKYTQGTKGSGGSVLDRLRGGGGSGGGAPPVGYKNKNGLTFQGGDPNDRKNWK